MKTKLLMSAAAIAVLMAGGVANAQSPGGARGESPAAAGASGGASAGGSGAVESQGSQKGMSAQEQSAPTKGHPREAQDNKMGKSPDSHTAADSKNSERMNKNSASDSKSGAEGKTTGNAATAAKGAPPVEKRSQLGTERNRHRSERCRL